MNAHEPGLILSPSVVMYIVTIGARKHTLRSWTEVGQLCARAFVDDPTAVVSIRHVRGPETACLNSEHVLL